MFDILKGRVMVSLLVFAIAFAAGCLSGLIFGLWSRSPRGGKSTPKPAFWPMSEDDSKTAHHR